MRPGMGHRAAYNDTVSRRRQRVALALGSAMLALLITEAGLRAASPWLFPDVVIQPDAVLGWSLKPGLRMFSRDENPLWVEHNSAGFRDREHAEQAPPGTRRIAVIGDSFIHGYFAPLGAMFSSFLERELTTCAPHPQPFEALSFGVFGYNTTQELLTYRHHAARYKPDIVLLAFFTLNDVFDNERRLSSEFAPRYAYEGNDLVLDNSFRDALPGPSRHPWRRRLFEVLLAQSRVFRLLKESADKAVRDWSRDAAPDPAPAVAAAETAIYVPPATPELQAAWRNTEGVLLKFRDEVRANGSEFWLMTLYNPIQVDPDVSKRRALESTLGVDSLFYPDRRLAAFAARHGIPVVSLAEPMAAETAATHRYLFGGDSAEVPTGQGHWNQAAAAAAARLAAAQMCRDSAALTTVLR
jgi:hypothetical protein